MLKLTAVAERLNCSVANVYALKDQGLLAVISTGANGRGYRVSEEELARFLEERKANRRTESPTWPASSSPKHLER